MLSSHILSTNNFWQIKLIALSVCLSVIVIPVLGKIILFSPPRHFTNLLIAHLPWVLTLIIRNFLLSFFFHLLSLFNFFRLFLLTIFTSYL